MAIQELCLAATADADLIATAEPTADGGLVEIWSLVARRRTASFAVAWDLGGRRLALTAEPVRVITAAYAYGVSAYDLAGARLWHREDLRKVQSIRPFRDREGQARLALGIANGPLAIVDAASGATCRRLRGVVEAYFGDDSTALHVLSGRVRLERDQRRHHLSLCSFAVLDAAFSDDAAVFSEAGGQLRCLTFAGEVAWELAFSPGSHALQVAWSSQVDRWLAIVWSFEHGGPHSLHQIDRQGNIRARAPLVGDLHGLSHRADALAIAGDRGLAVIDPIRHVVLADLERA